MKMAETLQDFLVFLERNRLQAARAQGITSIHTLLITGKGLLDNKPLKNGMIYA